MARCCTLCKGSLGPSTEMTQIGKTHVCGEKTSLAPVVDVDANG